MRRREASYYFLEVNTRLQVEHGVTEEVRGIDLVEWMIRVAAREARPLETLRGEPSGHSIQARVYAEDPAKSFQPSSGLLTEASFPEGVRCDTWIDRGTEVSAFYDPLLAKLVVWGETRDVAVERLLSALSRTRISGIETNLDYLRQIVATPEFGAGGVTTQFLATVKHTSNAIDVVSPGTQSTLQDYPGRVGYWAIGVPPSGPMDVLAFRLGNRMLGNPEDAATLEMTMTGPTLKFRSDALIALAGAPMKATLDGAPVPFWTPVRVRAGQTVVLGAHRGARRTRLPRRSRRLRRPAVSREPRDVHARRLRRPWRARAPDGRRAARLTAAGEAVGSADRAAARARSRLHERVGNRRPRRAARRARFLRQVLHGWLLRRQVEGSLQLGAHGRSPDRTEADLGALGRRRSGAASVQHSRQRLRGRYRRFHGRHADHSRSRRTEPRRLRLSGDHRHGRAVEDGAAEAR